MPFQLSAGLEFKETDTTAIVPSVGTSIGGFVGDFSWGPVGKLRMVDSENTLKQVFGKPTTANNVDYWSVGNFLSYSNACWVGRATDGNETNAASNDTGLKISNDVEQTTLNGYAAGVYAKYSGTYGNDLYVEVITNSTWGS